MSKSALSLLPPAGRAAVMGILNITPDSFSDGGQFCDGTAVDLDAVLRRAEAMVEAGVDILDVGGESTRPGATPVPVAQELDRVVPVVTTLKQHFSVPVSVDTSSAQVMAQSADAGADLLNDVRSFQRPGALQAAVATGLPVCLMHMNGEPGVMQHEPRYNNVVTEVKNYLLARVEDCVAAGIARDRILIDPGFGFGKTLDHNLALFRALPDLVAQGYPVLVGVSRKRMIGALLGRETGERLIGSVALAILAARAGAAVVRVHDVEQTIDALRILQAVEGSTD